MIISDLAKMQVTYVQLLFHEKNIDTSVYQWESLTLQTFSNRKWMNYFIINYFHDRWTHWSHTLGPLTILTYIKQRFKWAQVKQDSFEKIKPIVPCDTLWTYPDFIEIFKIHTNASAFQLGAVIIHKVKPIVFYSIKLTGAQQRYTVTWI